MRLSARGEYGVRAMVRLALNYREEPVPLSKIALSEDISQQFLEQIFSTLRKGGLINSVRGARGGYTLALPPDKICVGDIIRALEGPIAPVDCVSEEAGGDECLCGRTEECLVRNVWEQLRDRINEVLDNITLYDMLNWRS